MNNSYFQFKQFTVHQGDCAMKVTTDACILGAWMPIAEETIRMLDIGAGTGLLALMLAQRSPTSTIDAIEIDQAACTQAQNNISQSEWGNRINIINADIRGYSSPEKYDVIITNPPFFNNSLLGPTAKKNTARHTLSLNYGDLVAAFDKHLIEGGYAAILLPAEEFALFEKEANTEGWFAFHRLLVKHTDAKPVNRVIALFKKEMNEKEIVETLVIKEGDNAYTPEFSDLLRPFYLHL